MSTQARRLTPYGDTGEFDDYGCEPLTEEEELMALMLGCPPRVEEEGLDDLTEAIRLEMLRLFPRAS